MSHELRTPLNAIIGFSGVMANQRLGPMSNEQHVPAAIASEAVPALAPATGG